MSRWARPARPWAPMAAGVLVIGLWWLVAHNAGSGWVQLLGDVVFGTLLIGIAGPGVVVARARIDLRGAPSDGIAGTRVEVRLGASTRVRVRPVVPPGPEVFVGPGRRRHMVDDIVTLEPTCRGVHDTVTLDVASAAPFALQWWTKRVRVTLPSTLHVAPRLGRSEPVPQRPEEGDGEVVDRPRSDAGLPRGAWPYVPGDSRHLVHWRSTAHTGRLMVRELERPAAEPVTLTVDLPADRDAAERMAETALGTIVGLLEDGAPVLLDTREPSGRVLGAVADRRAAGRRLARAVAEPDAVAAGGGAGAP